MKKITAKVITISSQLLVVSLFLLLLFSNVDSNSESLVVNNNNFDKMADSTSDLFRKEELMIMSSSEEVYVELNSDSEEKSEDDLLIEEEISSEDKEEANDSFLDVPALEVHVGNLTGYGSDCLGCTGITSSGFDLRQSMYYEDNEYGLVRILAADAMFPFYSIFRVNVPGMDPFIGIVLDRGGNVGYGRGTLFDLAYITESDPNLIGLTGNVTFELLRRGE